MNLCELASICTPMQEYYFVWACIVTFFVGLVICEA